jgi:replicative DNA helicase
MKLEKIDGIILKFAFLDRKYMLSLVNRGIRADYFGDGADSVFKVLHQLFVDPTVSNIVSQSGFVQYCRSVSKDDTADFAEGLFGRINSLQVEEIDFGLYLKQFRDRFSHTTATKHAAILSAAVTVGVDNADLTELYEHAWKDISTLNRIEVFDEGTIADDMANMKAEYKSVAQNPGGFRGVTVGIPSLDILTNGFQPSELVVVAGMEGTGKSVVMMNMGINAWLGTNKIGRPILPTGKNVLYFTLEMPRSNRGKFGTGGYLNRRIMAAVAEVPFSAMRKGTLSDADELKLMNAFDFVTEYKKQNNFVVVDIPRGATVEDIELKFQEWREQFPIDLVIVDYMGIMAGSSTGKGDDADWQAQGQIAAGLHEFARLYSVPVVTGAQVNRPQGKNHSLKDQSYNTTRIARSAQITQNANIVMQIGCRDQEEDYPDMPIYITKMRDGNKGTLTWTKGFHCMRVYDGVPIADDLSQFEDAAGPQVPLVPIPVIYEDDECTPSTGARLDFGQSDDDDVEMDYSNADF